MTKQKPKPKPCIAVALILLMTLAAYGCTGGAFVKSTEATRTFAESVLYEARVSQNKGQLTAEQFATVKGVYDKLYDAQNSVIDARIAYLKATEGEQAKAEFNFKQATAVLGSVSADFVALAVKYGLGKGGTK